MNEDNAQSFALAFSDSVGHFRVELCLFASTEEVAFIYVSGFSKRWGTWATLDLSDVPSASIRSTDGWTGRDIGSHDFSADDYRGTPLHNPHSDGVTGTLYFREHHTMSEIRVRQTPDSASACVLAIDGSLRANYRGESKLYCSFDLRLFAEILDLTSFRHRIQTGG